MEFEEHEEQEVEEMGAAEYESMTNTSSARPAKTRGPTTGGGEDASRKPIRYRECLKNHAVSIGGHAVDGCGEFMAAGDEGTLESLKCAACSCHRNFHRKETDGASPLAYHHHQHQHQFSPYYRGPPAPAPAGYLHLTAAQPRPLALPSSSAGGYSREEENVSNPSSSGGGSGGTKKRHRTKFTAEQKEKMLGFADQLGWRIQKHDEASVEQFCAETGVKRHVLKVWMHNNKHTLGKKP